MPHSPGSAINDKAPETCTSGEGGSTIALGRAFGTADDSRGTTFVIIDKRSALLYVFDGRARLVATSPVLLGAALGDENVPGIGERPIALVRPEEAVSMHRVVTSNRAERRLRYSGLVYILPDVA